MDEGGRPHGVCPGFPFSELKPKFCLNLDQNLGYFYSCMVKIATSLTERTTRYCTEVMEKIREVEMKMSPHALRPFSSTSWVAWMLGSVNLSMSLDSW